MNLMPTIPAVKKCVATWITAVAIALALTQVAQAANPPQPSARTQQPTEQEANAVCFEEPAKETSVDTPQLLAANANCASDCESRFNLCLKEAKTDAIRDKCKVYFKGCLKSCSQGK